MLARASMHPPPEAGSTRPATAPAPTQAAAETVAVTRVPAGSLQVPEQLVGTELAAGSFRVALRRDPATQAAVLEVRHADAPDRVALRTIPGESFLTSADGEARVGDRRGHLRMRDRRRDATSSQVIDTMRRDGDRIVLAGTLHRAGRRADAEPVRWRIEFAPTDRERLGLRASVTSGDGAPRHDRVTLTVASDRDERVYGFGMQYTHVDLKGRNVPVLASEQGIGRGRQPLTAAMNAIAGAGGASTMGYATLPHFLTSGLRSLFLEQSDFAQFDLRRRDRIAIEVHDDELRAQVAHGASPKALVGEYAEYTGRMRALPN